MPYAGYDTLKSLELSANGESVKVPKTRMEDPLAVQNYARRLIDNDERRAWKRARVNGLVDGNPPYAAADLRRAGRAEACNVNWGTGRSYLESAAGAFYDLFSEAEGFMSVRTAHGSDEEREQWSNDISVEADRVLKRDRVWDYEMSVAIDNLILHGCGPMLFEDGWKPVPKAFLAGDLKVPEFTKSDITYWDSAMIQGTYFPPELYKFIEDRETATSVGWNVDYTRRFISYAMGLRNQAGVLLEWEFYQQELKNNSLSYYDEPRVCRVAHVFWKEFDGRITHAIVPRDSAEGLVTEYLYQHIGRYAGWNEVVHPLYYDHGNGGYHHSVTGLGVKMFSAMEYENRLLCNACDKAFAPKILFKPTTAEARQKFELSTYGEFGVLPKGVDSVQSPVGGLLDDGLALLERIGGLMSSNLSGYRQQMPPKSRGNPPTKWQKQYEAALESALSKTQFNRFYAQLDALYREIYRRLSNVNTQDRQALEFQERCKDRGVPVEALAKVDDVRAVRVAGQGSSFMRKSAIDSLLMIAGSLPEEGRTNLLADKVAAEAGQSAVERYYPRARVTGMTNVSGQQAEAIQWVGVMKTGIPAVVTSEQNPVIYAGAFLDAATAAIQSLEQGASPPDVLKFLDVIGPAIAAQLQRFAQDPTRQQVHEAMVAQWQELAKAVDKLKEAVQQMLQGQQKQQEATQQTMTDNQLKSAKTGSDIALKTAKTRAQMQQSREKHELAMRQKALELGMTQREWEQALELDRRSQQQDMALADMSTASDIERQRLQHQADMAQQQAEMEAETQTTEE